MSLHSRIARQFSKPNGLLGGLAGWIMAHRPSNVQRNAWTVDLLNLEPHHRVLELGCGPGLALKACAARVTEGRIVGLDHSEVMIGQAARRLASEITAGKVRLKVEGLEATRLADASFDRIFSLNVVQFLPDVALAYRIFFDALTDGGIAATTYQPRTKRPTREQAFAMADKVSAAMRSAGFEEMKVHRLDLEPAPAICVTGVKRGQTDGEEKPDV